MSSLKNDFSEVNPNSQRFHLGDMLSITTGRLVAPDHMDGVSAILDWMTNDKLHLHQLGRAKHECIPYLLDQFPWLAEAGERLVANITMKPRGEHPDCTATMVMWLADLIATYGEYHDVRRIPVDDHDRIDPVVEFKQKYPHIRVVDLRDDDEADNG